MNSQNTPNIGRMIEAVSAVRSWRELILFSTCGFFGAGLFGFAIRKIIFGGAQALLGYLFMAVGVVILFAGYYTVSARFTDEIRGVTPRGIFSGLGESLLNLPAAILVTLIYLVIFVLELLVAALLLMVCQIPQIGPVLNFIIFPILSIIFGGTLYALLFVAAPLSVCALTEGKSIMQTVSLVVATVRSRLTEVVFMGVVLLLVVVVVAITTVWIAGMGIGVTTGMAAAVHISGVASRFDGGDPSSAALQALMGSGMGMGGVLGMLQSAMSGAALLFAAIGGACVLVFIKGWCLIYVQVGDTLDLAGTEAFLNEKMQQAKEKAAQAKLRIEEEARRRKEQMQAAQANRAQSVAASQAGATRSQVPCKACNGVLTPEDKFCPECGTPR